ncbi:MAG: PKD domain-containing protein [Bacteroidia bacterium]
MKKIITIASLALTLNAFAQCSPSFTYTTTNSSISVTSTSTGTTTSTMYNWILSGGANLNHDSYGSSYVFSQLYNGTYTVSLSLDSSACSSAVTQTFTISGGTNPPACSASFTYTLGTSGQVSFTNTSPVDPLANTSYPFYLGVGGNMYNYSSSTYTIPSYTYYYNGTYTVTLSTSNSMDGCSTSSTQTISITNAHQAAPCTQAFTYTLGATGQANFTSSYTGTAPGITYDWVFGDGSTCYYCTSTTTHTYAYNGNYGVSLSIRDTANNCDSNTVSTQTLAITNTATVPCVPSVSFSIWNHDSLTTLPPHVWNISPYYSSQVTSAVWHWGDGTSTAGLYPPTHTYSVAAIYTICVTVYSGCGDSSTTCQNDSLYRLAQNNSTNSTMIQVTVVNASTAGIKQVAVNNEVTIYPNPASQLVNLKISNFDNANTNSVEVYNTIGECVHRQIITSSNSQIDVSDLAEGVYNLQIVNNRVPSGSIVNNKRVVITK